MNVYFRPDSNFKHHYTELYKRAIYSFRNRLYTVYNLMFSINTQRCHSLKPNRRVRLRVK